MSIKYVSLIIFLFYSFYANAHKSPEPIDIPCGLRNVPYVQYVTFAPSKQVLKEHFELENGAKSWGDSLETEVPAQAVLKTKDGDRVLTGSFTVTYYESGAIEVNQANVMAVIPQNALLIQFIDDATYNESFNNQIISCQIFP